MKCACSDTLQGVHPLPEGRRRPAGAALRNDAAVGTHHKPTNAKLEQHQWRARTRETASVRHSISDDLQRDKWGREGDSAEIESPAPALRMIGGRFSRPNTPVHDFVSPQTPEGGSTIIRSGWPRSIFCSACRGCHAVRMLYPSRLRASSYSRRRFAWGSMIRIVFTGPLPSRDYVTAILHAECVAHISVA